MLPVKYALCRCSIILTLQLLAISDPERSRGTLFAQKINHSVVYEVSALSLNSRRANKLKQGPMDHSHQLLCTETVQWFVSAWTCTRESKTLVKQACSHVTNNSLIWFDHPMHADLRVDTLWLPYIRVISCGCCNGFHYSCIPCKP